MTWQDIPAFREKMGVGHKMVQLSKDHWHEFILFDGLFDFINRCEDAAKQPEMKDIVKSQGAGEFHKQYSDISESERWSYGEFFRNANDAKQSLISGQPAKEVSSLYDKALDSLMSTDVYHRMSRVAMSSKRCASVFSDEGGDLCIDRVMSGDFNYWRRKDKKIKKSIDLYVNISMSGGNNAESFAKVGALAVATAYISELAGIPTQIMAMESATNVSEFALRQGFLFPIKSASEPLDTMAVLSALSSPMLLRRYGFINSHLFCSGKMNSGFGCALQLSEPHQKALGIDFLISKSWEGKEQQLFQNILDKVAPEFAQTEVIS